MVSASMCLADDLKTLEHRSKGGLRAIQHVFVVVSSEDDVLLVKGGIGTYTALLTRIIAHQHPEYWVHWITEALEGQTEISVLEQMRVVRHYIPRRAPSYAEPDPSEDKSLAPTPGIALFGTKISNYLQNLISQLEKQTGAYLHLIIEAPDWEGLLRDFFTANQKPNILKVVRLHSSLRICAGSNALDISLPEPSAQDIQESEQIARCDILSSPTEYMLAHPQNRVLGLTSTPWTIVPNPIDKDAFVGPNVSRDIAIDLFRSNTGVQIESGNYNIFIVGSVEIRKGIQIVLKSIPSVISRVHNAHFYFIGHTGDGVQLTANGKFSSSQILELVPKAFLKHIHLTGYVEHSLLPQLYQAGDVFPICYLSDNFPNTLTEIALAKRPVIVLVSGGLTELARDGERSLCYEITGANTGDLAQSLADKIEHVSLFAEQAQGVAEEFQLHILKKFDSHINVERMLSFYQGCLATKALSDTVEVGSLLPILASRNTMGSFLESLGLKSGAEIGVQRGKFAERTLKAWPSCQKYYLIDCWQEQPNYHDVADVDNSAHEEHLQETRERMNPFVDKVHFLRMYSVDAAKCIPDGELDFVYIDARHDYDSVLEDMAYYYPKVREGGVFAGHDFVDNDFVLTQGLDWSYRPDGTKRGDLKAVKSAVTEFVTKKRKQLLVTYADGNWPTWYFRR